MRRLLPALSAIALTLLVAGCGGDGDDEIDRADHGLIVYEARADDVVNVFTIDPNTGETRQLTQGTSFDGNPGWSPDRRRIIFSSDRDSAEGNEDVYTMDVDGGDVRRLTSTPADHEFSAKFSPDGKRIAYAVRREDDNYFITVMDADGSDAREVAGPYRFAEFPAWTPDGDEIYFTGESEDTRAFDVLAVDAEGGDVRVSISNDGADVCPHFTRDGKFMLYARSPLDVPNQSMDIYAHDVTSEDTTGADDLRLTDHATRDDYASPSPDGSRLVYLADRDGNTELYTMAPDGSDERRLTTTPNARENVPDW